jgi:transcriptional regulator with XRE-family HTH domain
MLRQERKERKLTLADLAGQLGISVPYLSQIETGTKPLQETFIEKTVRVLGLIGEDANKLRRAAALSMSEYNIRLAKNAPQEDRLLAAALATGFARMSPTKKEEIRRIMKEDVRG